MVKVKKGTPKVTKKAGLRDGPRIKGPSQKGAWTPIPGDPGEPITGGPKGLSADDVDLYTLSSADGAPQQISAGVTVPDSTSLVRVTLIGDDGAHFDIASKTHEVMLTAYNTKIATLDVRSAGGDCTYEAKAYSNPRVLIDPPAPQ